MKEMQGKAITTPRCCNVNERIQELHNTLSIVQDTVGRLTTALAAVLREGIEPCPKACNDVATSSDSPISIELDSALDHLNSIHGRVLDLLGRIDLQ